MQDNPTNPRRDFLKVAAGAGLAALAGSAGAQPSPNTGHVFECKPNQRYPDPAIQILDPSFGKHRIYSSSVEQLASGMRGAEGPVYFPAGRYLLVSDIPNNRIMKYDETNGAFSVFRDNANFANRGRVERHAQPQHLGLRRGCQRQPVEQRRK